MQPFARVVVLDSHPLIRLSLRQHFSESTGLRVVADFAHATHLLAYLDRAPADVAIVDDASTDAIAEITRRSGCKVVVFTDGMEAPIERHARLPGATAVVHKRSSLYVLHAAVRSSL